MSELNPELSIRIMQPHECGIVTEYFQNLSEQDLERLSIQPARLMEKIELEKIFESEHNRAIEDMSFLHILWLLDKKIIGFSAAEKISYGKEANIHLHIVTRQLRNKGLGLKFVKMTVEFLFEHLELEFLYCEPSANNPPPNKTLKRAGFRHLNTYSTVPSPINYQHSVNRWQIQKADLSEQMM